MTRNERRIWPLPVALYFTLAPPVTASSHPPFLFRPCLPAPRPCPASDKTAETRVIAHVTRQRQGVLPKCRSAAVSRAAGSTAAAQDWSRAWRHLVSGNHLPARRAESPGLSLSKARNVIAWGGAPGAEPQERDHQIIILALQGRHRFKAPLESSNGILTRPRRGRMGAAPGKRVFERHPG